MFLDIFFLVIILLGIAVIGFVVIRKFPQISNLDVNSLPQEKVSRKKQEIISRRIEEQGKAFKANSEKFFVPLRKVWGQLQLKFRIYVGKIERLWHHEQTRKQKVESNLSPEELEQKINQLITDGEQCLQLNQFDRAEEKFIAVIKLNNRVAAAYRGLGDAYFARELLEEARETYRFVLQLESEDDSVLVKLAGIAESQGDLEEAIEYYQKAVLVNDSLSPRFAKLAELLVKIDQPEAAREAALGAIELEPQNPKYLDLLAEVAILCRDKALADRAYNDLRLVNPENNKLADLRERINLI